MTYRQAIALRQGQRVAYLFGSLSGSVQSVGTTHVSILWDDGRFVTYKPNYFHLLHVPAGA